MTGIRYVQGDATFPQGAGPKIIAHVCNDIGAWGRGFVLAISRRWSKPERSYRGWKAGKDLQPFELGEVQFVQVEPDLTVASMLAQHGIMKKNGSPAVRYTALQTCLATVGDLAGAAGAAVHMPRIGCGLAGGSWDQVEPLVQAGVAARGVPVTVYDLPGEGRS